MFGISLVNKPGCFQNTSVDKDCCMTFEHAYTHTHKQLQDCKLNTSSRCTNTAFLDSIINMAKSNLSYYNIITFYIILLYSYKVYELFTIMLLFFIPKHAVVACNVT